MPKAMRCQSEIVEGVAAENSGSRQKLLVSSAVAAQTSDKFVAPLLAFSTLAQGLGSCYLVLGLGFTVVQLEKRPCISS